jgi:DNA-binding transcriptional regulator/RsmH inhibitor MraZ
MELWRGNLKLMNSRRDLRDAVRTVRFIAEHYGSEVEMDAQGRITLNPELRRTLGLENQGLHLNADTSGKIEIMTDSLYEEERKRAERLKIEADLDILREAGLQ